MIRPDVNIGSDGHLGYMHVGEFGRPATEHAAQELAALTLDERRFLFAMRAYSTYGLFFAPTRIDWGDTARWFRMQDLGDESLEVIPEDEDPRVGDSLWYRFELTEAMVDE